MIEIISSCTNSKTIKSEDIFSIENYNSTEKFDNIRDEWKNKIKKNSFKKYLAYTLYKGVGWKATTETYIYLSNYYKTNLHIASAGYGLISHDSYIASYNATFTPRTLNSIDKFNKNKISNITWWDTINRFNVDSFSENSYIFIILPQNYLFATQNLIKKLISLYGERVFIFKANKSMVLPFMKNHIIEFDLRFNSYQTGTLSTLLQRAVLWFSKEIIENSIPFKHQYFQEHIERKMQKYTVYKMPKRIQLTDNKLHKGIKDMILNHNIVSASQGLKYLRKNGNACEQKRFTLLFKTLKSELKL